ncbi:MAG: YddF family protein [Candidatus Caldarchaeum sp.]
MDETNVRNVTAAGTSERGVSPAAHASVSGGAGAEDKPATYLLNTPGIFLDESLRVAVIRVRRISAEDARRILLTNGYVSAIGHEGTAQVLTQLLAIDVPMQRIQVKLNRGDSVVAFVLKTRLPEGKVLTADELRRLPYEFLYYQVTVDESE